MSWHGQFCWYELMASDLDRTAAFYGSVVGWEVRSADMPGIDYRLFTRDGHDMAGLMGRMEGGAQGWIGYVAVDDTDRAAAEAKAAGGTIHRGRRTYRTSAASRS